MTNTQNLHGSMVAIVTPFADGQVDYETMGKLIEFQIEGGTQGIVPCGTTGESPTLSHIEHGEVIEFTIKQVAGRVPVIAGTGSNSTSEAVRLTQRAKDAGADACLIVNPYYNKPTQHGMIEHMKRIGDVDLPIVLYNIPGRTSIEMTCETIVTMYNDIGPVVAIKEATGKLDLASEIASACDITILSGDDSLTLPLASVGAKGVISVLANILPGPVRSLCDAIAADDFTVAREMHQKLFRLFKGMFAETNPIPIKAAMAMAGMIRNELRLPMTPLSEPCRQPLANLLEEFGVELKA
ncbi:MAG: 4-hydroxy-tetrahydrodipicolinate synthase [Phycisphaerales bacterium]|jgi:4-hydroxy-tetrahydrodipicolinate synthase|nr:4-hydroxy-tetrahydrodipicolinate synthase [Phycisphaerales bacterium]